MNMVAPGTSTVGTNHRRRAVYTALGEVFKEPARVDDAFHFCEEFCHSEPKFLVNRFLMRAEQKAKIDEHERQALAKAMYLAFSKPYDALSRYPDRLVIEAAVAPVKAAALAAPAAAPAKPQTAALAGKVNSRPAGAGGFEPVAAHRVFQTVMAHLINRMYHAYGRRPARIGLALAAATAQARGETHTLSMLIDWLDGDLDEYGLPENLPLEEMRSTLRIVQIAARNVMGREAAEQALTQAMGLAGSLHEALQFAPAQLLGA